MGRRLYWRPPDEERLAQYRAIGFDIEDMEPATVVVWPDNGGGVRVFRAWGPLGGGGAAGPTGLDYGVLPEIWRRLRVPPDQRDAVFMDLRVIEGAALEQMHTKEI